MRKSRQRIGLLLTGALLGVVASLLLSSTASATGISVGPITIGPVTIGLPGGSGATGSGSGGTSAPTTTGFSFSASSYSVDMDAGDVVITVVRGGTSLPAAQVRYHTPPLAIQTALADVDYTPVNGVLDFAEGQTSASFAVPIVDLHTPALPATDFFVELYGASPTPLGATTSAAVAIEDTDSESLSKIVGNPLGLAASAGAASAGSTSANPLAGVYFFVDKQWGTAAIAAHEHPADARKLDVIASQPVAMRFVSSNTRSGAGLAVSRFIQRAASQERGTVPEISTYELNHSEACTTSWKGPGAGRYSDSPAQVAAYESWIRSLASGISTNRAVVYLEIDGLITTPCLGPTGLHRRIEELSYAINQLSALPRTAVYVDAGAADALSAREAAKLLNEIGVRKIQGFFLNATHYDWTLNEIKYGDEISKLTGGAHFVVNTAVNGRGPMVPQDRVKQGNEVRCNPPGRGLGPKPTTDTGFKNVDAFAWIGNPGLSTGTCGNPRVNPPTGVFDLSYALSLVQNADFAVR